MEQPISSPADKPEISPSVETLRENLRLAEIEDSLESLKVDERVDLLEQVVEPSESKLSSFFDKASGNAKSILGAVLFAVASHGAVADVGDRKEIPGIGTFEHSQMAKKNMQAVVGFDLVGEAMKLGKTATLITPEKDKPTDLTIMHLGQTHKTEPKTNDEYRDRIVKSQAGIAELLKVATTSSTKVFAEGYIAEEREFTQQRRILKKFLDSMPTADAAIKTYNNFLTLPKTKYMIPELNKAMGDKLVSLGFKEDTPLSYSNGNETIVLLPSGLLPEDKAYTMPNDQQALMRGAVEMLDQSIALQMEPAETKETNSRAFAYIPGLQEKAGRLGNLLKILVPAPPIGTTQARIVNDAVKSLPEMTYWSSHTVIRASQIDECKKNVECSSLVKEIVDIDLPQAAKAIYDDREDAAVELIAKSALANHGQQKVFPLVYGSAHDFTRAIVKWNATHPTMQFNLVAVK